MRMAAAIPILAVPDVTASAGYFREVLGFTVEFVWGNPPEYAGIERDEAEIHLRADGGVVSEHRVAILMDGVDAYHDEVRQRGAEVTVPIGDRDYGIRDFAVRTPDGHFISFGQGLDG
jgi:catechol 2,3-dioxygenase-like lactoylglutathione lyase family enzyme